MSCEHIGTNDNSKCNHSRHDEFKWDVHNCCGIENIPHHHSNDLSLNFPIQSKWMAKLRLLKYFLTAVWSKAGGVTNDRYFSPNIYKNSQHTQEAEDNPKY
jgi:hypothetical protein